MNLTELYLDAAKFDANLNHYKRMAKIAERLSNRIRTRIVLAQRIMEEEERLALPIMSRTGFEHINLKYLKTKMALNESMIEVLRTALEVANRTYPRHEA